jgi:opacity protein-like surface antigen
MNVMLSRHAHRLIATAILALSPVALAEDFELVGASPFGHGKKRIALTMGSGSGFDFLQSRGNQNSDVEGIVALGSWSNGISERLAAESWYAGNVDLVGEGQLLFNQEPHSGFFGAGTLSLRYNLLNFGRVVPFARVGAGVGYLAYDLDDQRDGFNFTLQAGVGLHWSVAARRGLFVEYRYHHISNANTRHPNAGINSQLLVIGTVIYLD